MATTININRNGNVVTFETVNIPTFDLVLWCNQDPQEAHWPYLPGASSQVLSASQIGPKPSKNSSAVPLTNPGGTVPANPPNLVFQLIYQCKLHQHEQGVINVFNPFQPAATTTLPSVPNGTPINQPVATGGMSPYTITAQAYQVVPTQGTTQSGSGSPGPGLSLVCDPSNGGISVTGTPTVSGTYTFAFDANDGMGLNIQQAQFTMVVT